MTSVTNPREQRAPALPSAGVRVCTRCVMDTTDPEITFDAHGVCSHCHSYDEAVASVPQGEAKARILADTVERIKREGRDKEYDCLIGVSGGVDSTYTALKVKELGLRPLAVHFDSGWNSELAVANIEKVVKALDIDLITHVVDWDEMRDLQLAFLRAGVANADIPTDHGFVAVLYQLAAQHGIRYLISGHNMTTEWILPKAWGYGSRDLRHIRAIQRRFGTRRLKRYPQLGLLYDVVYVRLIKRIRKFELLNYLPQPYVKAEAMRVIQERLGWRYYGGKHYESVFTRFFQAYYLPVRFGFDKRKAHLSSLIVSGQLSREEALEELRGDTYPPELLEQDRLYVIKKLGISEQEFDAIMRAPTHTHRDFPSNEALIRSMFAVRSALRGVRSFVRGG
jgi:N-acetyl sugar amidotransferase